MAVGDQLGIPAANSVLKGRFKLSRVHISEAGAAEPVTPTNIENLISFNIDKPSFDEVEIGMQGGGDDLRRERSNYKWTGNLVFHDGKAGDALAILRNLTWDTANDSMIPLRRDTLLPDLHWEAILRAKDNTTHIASLVIQEMIIDLPGYSNPYDTADFEVPFYTDYMPFLLKTGCEMVYDVYDGDGSTTDFTLSSTPLTVATASSYDQLDIDELVFVKVKLTGESTGTRQKSGVSYAGGDVTFTTAPAASSEIQIFYPKET